MSLVQILYYPDERLRKIAEPVINIDDNIRHIVDIMFETMYARVGIGLAATQINIQQQIIVIDISEHRTQPLVLINPKLQEKKGTIRINEGCLSIPNQYYFVNRAQQVKIQAFDNYGNNFELEADNLLAVCIQHEMDHLIGKLFIDYLSPLKRQRIHKKMKKLLRISDKDNKNYRNHYV